ncbi:MAG: hypothetical protein CMQ05_10910 [Gammaproteobacteria bacterium]|nr:hypothetical protein [Gammaproteobacteria bacterium]RPG24312.1 MAG: hypothetical protein CBC10_011880 [Gammaproteobacteria bacterium TMED50]
MTNGTSIYDHHQHTAWHTHCTQHGNVNVFRGIRFAEPPEGDRRFKPPVMTSAWNDRGTLDATAFGNRAI